jgi:hypothetical protein
VLVGLDSDAEMHVRAWMFGIAAGPDRADGLALAHDGASRHLRSTDMRQRHRIAVGGRDRDRQAGVRHRADERHCAVGRRPDRLGCRRGDVDSAVLAGGVGIGADGERAQDRPADRPRPGLWRGGSDETESQCEDL